MKKSHIVGALIAAILFTVLYAYIMLTDAAKIVSLVEMLALVFLIFALVSFVGAAITVLSTNNQRKDNERYCRDKQEKADHYSIHKREEADQYYASKVQTADQYYNDKREEAVRNNLSARKNCLEYCENRRNEADRYYEEKRAEAEQYIASLPEKTIRECIAAREKTDQYCKTKREEADRHFQEVNADLDGVLQKSTSNLTAIPYMAGIIADYETRNLEILASSLDWGANVARQNKVASIREIRKEAQEAITASKQAEYQLAYAIQMFPGLEDFLETDYNDLQDISISDIETDHRDAVRNYLTKEEYQALPSVERNQLALDRYLQSHRRTNWQVGRDYELYVGYRCSKEGYSIDYYGANKGLEDLGRDIIAKKDDITLIIQCKYWGKHKVIREKHINQLYGTTICYCYENSIPQDNVRAVFVTNTTVSDTAKDFAKYLGVEVIENFATGNYPCIKCNINRDEQGNATYIYHLPFDQQYDSCKIDAPGEFFALTCAEAEAAGFRRAYRWHSAES